MKVTMCAPLMEGYGQTESTGGCFITASEDPNVGYVGGPAVFIYAYLVKCGVQACRHPRNEIHEQRHRRKWSIKAKR